MTKKSEVLKILGCTLLGVLVVEGLLLLVALFRFGVYAPEPFVRFIAVTNPMAGIAGGCFGFFLGRALGRRPGT
jgi:hypothetical protein